MSYRRMFPDDDARTPGRDWLVALVWACIAAMCLGFLIGAVFTIVEIAS